MIHANIGSILTITVVSFAATFAVSGLVPKYLLKKEWNITDRRRTYYRSTVQLLI